MLRGAAASTAPSPAAGVRATSIRVGRLGVYSAGILWHCLGWVRSSLDG